jgi:hypothetical protein
MRSRNIKPAFFKNDLLAELDHAARLLFIGLWCLADRNGLVEYRARRIRAEVFPYEPEIDVDGYITVISRLGFIRVLTDGNNDWILIENFSKHQNPHHTEKTKLPDPKSLKEKGSSEVPDTSPLSNVMNPADSLLLIPDSCSIEQTEEKPKSSRRGERISAEELPEEWRQFCIEERPDLNPESVFVQFRDYWVSVPGQKGVKLDWKATWRNWVRNQRGQNNGAHQQDNRSRAKRVSDKLDEIARRDIEENGHSNTLD